MSIALAQKALQAVLIVGLKQIQGNSEIRRMFLDNFSDFDATFRQFNSYANLYNVAIENFIEPINEIEKFIGSTEFIVKQGYPRLNAQLPEICIVLGNDSEGSGSVGNIANETRDDLGNQKVEWLSDKQKSLNIHIVDMNPDSVEILHNIIDYILVTHRTLLAQMGLNGCHFDASDIHPNPEGLQSGIFLFERIITVNCEVYQTYKTSFYGHSPMPIQVVMSSELIEENDVDVDVLEEEAEVTITPPENIGDIYMIGDQVSKNTHDNFLFRGATAESSMSEAIITSLAIATFEQQIEGEWILDAFNEYIVFAYPKSLGEIIFKIGGTLATFYRQEINITNENDEVIIYFVYRSESLYNGTKTLTTIKI